MIVGIIVGFIIGRGWGRRAGQMCCVCVRARERECELCVQGPYDCILGTMFVKTRAWGWARRGCVEDWKGQGSTAKGLDCMLQLLARLL